MFGFNNKKCVVAVLNNVDQFEMDIVAFEEWAEVGTVANSIVISAIKKAETNKVYMTLSGLQKEYARVTNDAVFGKYAN